MKIIVTGGAGFIGSHTADLLVSKEHKVVVIDNLSSGKEDNVNPKTIFYKEDISNFEKIKEIFEKEKPEIVYHFAAQINVRKSVENPIEDAKTNILGTLNLLELSIKNGVKHFIFPSSGAVYGNSKFSYSNEENPKDPTSPYGCAKSAIEEYLKFYNKTYGLKFTALRYSNVYGPRQNPDGEAGVISIFLNQMFSGIKPKIFGGIQKRDFIYVKDIAEANLKVIEDKKSKIYNVATGTGTDIIEIFNRINKYFNNEVEPEYSKMKKGDPMNSCLSNKKIEVNLGWRPSTNLEQGLDQTYCWFLKNQKNNS